MAISRRLLIVFMAFYIAIIIYLFLFFLVPEFRESIMESRKGIAGITEGGNYLWAILISIGICLIGNASIGFPIPFPFILFSFSNSIYLRYSMQGFILEEVFMIPGFWFEILGIAIAGGFGSALGEFTSFLLGKGAKIVAEKTGSESKTLANVEGFGKLVLEHPNRMYLYIFVAAALPIPDDPLWIALGMSEEKFSFTKCLIFGWMGKNITTLFYVMLPILISIGVTSSGVTVDDTSSIITESVMLMATLSIMLFILAFDWNKYLENRKAKKAQIEE